mmetsp:Transcript_14539/g.37297  ORF Transcript_14539/g.37297 Transcript_14539/m.37297 type:complete len:317 (-) Transcript_14539:1261-2211(-)
MLLGGLGGLDSERCRCGAGWCCYLGCSRLGPRPEQDDLFLQLVLLHGVQGWAGGPGGRRRDIICHRFLPCCFRHVVATVVVTVEAITAAVGIAGNRQPELLHSALQRLPFLGGSQRPPGGLLGGCLCEASQVVSNSLQVSHNAREAQARQIRRRVPAGKALVRRCQWQEATQRDILWQRRTARGGGSGVGAQRRQQRGSRGEKGGASCELRGVRVVGERVGWVCGEPLQADVQRRQRGVAGQGRGAMQRGGQRGEEAVRNSHCTTRQHRALHHLAVPRAVPWRRPRHVVRRKRQDGCEAQQELAAGGRPTGIGRVP